jgi:hypothetical protein
MHTVCMNRTGLTHDLVSGYKDEFYKDEFQGLGDPDVLKCKFAN